MPAPSPSGQPDTGNGWFGSSAGQALLHSQSETVRTILADARGLPWLWLCPTQDGGAAPAAGRGLRLVGGDREWNGGVRCGVPLPLASESIGIVVLQHVLTRGEHGRALLQECARIAVPGARLALFALNPLAPYRWRWRGAGLQASEPLAWRRRLREAGFAPDPLSQGIGPNWREAVSPGLQQGAGLRAAYLLMAEKRTLPLTPVRARRSVAMPDGVPAT